MHCNDLLHPGVARMVGVDKEDAVAGVGQAAKSVAKGVERIGDANVRDAVQRLRDPQDGLVPFCFGGCAIDGAGFGFVDARAVGE